MAVVAVVAVCTLATCDKKEEKELGGVTWAATNVDDYQTFATRPDMYTKFYQWNRSTAWAATSEVFGWTETEITDIAWTVNPCPAGWRLPTQEEFHALHDAGSTWAEANAKGNAVAGRFYGANHATCTMSNLNGCIFLPAVGNRFLDGVLYGQGNNGFYWSAPQDGSASNNGSYGLTFDNSRSEPRGYGSKAGGRSVRCVK